MSKEQAKAIFKDGVTTWEEKTMNAYTDVVYQDIDAVYGETNKNLNRTMIRSGVIEENSPSYPKPIATTYLPRHGIVNITWVKTDANNKQQAYGEAIFLIHSNKASIVSQKTDGGQPITMSVANDGLTPQFNQTTGYWARISYIAAMNVID